MQLFQQPDGLDPEKAKSPESLITEQKEWKGESLGYLRVLVHKSENFFGSDFEFLTFSFHG